MNKERRKRLRKIVTDLVNAKSRVEGVLEEEDDARDNMPENLQDSSRYSDSEDCSEAMENAVESIDDAIASIKDIV